MVVQLVLSQFSKSLSPSWTDVFSFSRNLCKRDWYDRIEATGQISTEDVWKVYFDTLAPEAVAVSFTLFRDNQLILDPF